MSMQTKALIERWYDFRDVAIAEACIQYHEQMLDCWKETLEQEMRSLNDAYYWDDGDEEIPAIDVLRELEEDSRGKWYGCDYHNYVYREHFKKTMIRNLDFMCRRWKFADDMEGEEE